MTTLPHSGGGTSPDEAARTVVELRGVGRTYPSDPPVHALRRCDLSVRAGDFVTVMGPSGSGKSTFLHVVGLLDRPTAGEYRLDGIDVGGLSERERTALRGRRIGFVFQAFQLLEHRTCLENVMLATLYRGGVVPDREQKARAALDAVGLAGRAESRPSRMSGGERQRVAIARALAGEPSLLLCDEPTGNLDSASSSAVMRLFEDLHEQGITIVLITHDASVAARGTRLVTMRDGVMTETAAGLEVAP